MSKALSREITLSIQAKTAPASPSWSGRRHGAGVAHRLRIPLRQRLRLVRASHYGSVVAGLMMTGIFVVIALIAALICALIRRRVRERAILARAAKAHSPSWLLDPRVWHRRRRSAATIGLAAHGTGCPPRHHGGAMGARTPRAGATEFLN